MAAWQKLDILQNMRRSKKCRPSLTDTLRIATVTRAKARIEAYAEERLFDRDGQRGAEFSLRYNFRWVNDEKKDDGGESMCGVAELPAVMPAPQDAGGDANGEA